MMTDAVRRRAIFVFFIVVALAAIANGMSDAVMSNYYKDAYNVTASQRGFIEFPRETPGALCAILIAALSALGDIRISVIAHTLAAAALLVLGLFTPTYALMLVFLFFYSMGTHLFLPVQDAICMSLAEPEFIGRRMGQYTSIKAAFSFVAAGAVFFGFRSGVFDFTKQLKLNFVIGAAAFALAAVATVALLKTVSPPKAAAKKFQLVLRKEYKYYYMLTVLGGVQKQITLVFGSWVVVDMLDKGADVMAMLYIVANFICIFFMRVFGKWMDKLGIKSMMFLDGFLFVGVYIVYGLAVWSVSSEIVPLAVSTAAIYALFIGDRLATQAGVVKSVYLRSIAWNPAEVSAVLSTGTSLDHIVTVFAGMAGGLVWDHWGGHWVFFMAATISIGNVIVAMLVKPDEEKALAMEMREKLGVS